MARLLRAGLLVIALLTYLLAAPLVDHIRAGGFESSRIMTSRPLIEMQEVEGPGLALQQVLKQPFYYLGKGAQCYAFRSADGEFVLKFFKQQHLHLPVWVESLPLPFIQSSRRRKYQREKALFAAHRIAWERCPDVAGLVQVHLEGTRDLWGGVRLVDPAGRESWVELDHHQFVLQRYAQRIDRAYMERVDREEIAQAEQLVAKAVEVVRRRLQAGVVDDDPAFLQNYGVTSSEDVVHFDVGTWRCGGDFDFEERLGQETKGLLLLR